MEFRKSVNDSHIRNSKEEDSIISFIYGNKNNASYIPKTSLRNNKYPNIFDNLFDVKLDTDIVIKKYSSKK